MVRIFVTCLIYIFCNLATASTTIKLSCSVNVKDEYFVSGVSENSLESIILEIEKIGSNTFISGSGQSSIQIHTKKTETNYDVTDTSNDTKWEIMTRGVSTDGVQMIRSIHIDRNTGDIYYQLIRMNKLTKTVTGKCEKVDNTRLKF
jgi:hypothetical protein